jgi:hypothetical protein
MHAEGGARAIGSVSIRRPDDTSGDFTFKAGSVVATEDGRAYVTLQDITFTTGVLALDVPVQSVADGWDWNVRGERTAASGVTMPPLVDLVVRSNTDPAYADPRLIAYGGDMTGGRGPALDAVANDRGVLRGGVESDDSLSYRARTLPDTVSPAAILRLLHNLLDPTPVAWRLVETFEANYQEFYDAPSLNVGTPSYQAVPPTSAQFNTNTFELDDPRDPDLTFRNRTMDDPEYRAAFVVVLQRVTLRDTGFMLDDTGMTPADFHPAAGHPWRQTPALDLDSTMPTDVVFGCCYDGVDVDEQALTSALWTSLKAIRAGGVAAVIDYVRP